MIINNFFLDKINFFWLGNRNQMEKFRTNFDVALNQKGYV